MQPVLPMQVKTPAFTADHRMTHKPNTISLLCPSCCARGKAIRGTDAAAPLYRHDGLEDLSRGFRHIDRGARHGAHFVCVSCNLKAKEL